MTILKSKWTWLCLLILLAGAGMLGWMERTALAAWYHAGLLVRAPESERERHLQELTPLEHAAIPALLRHVVSNDDVVRTNAGWALTQLARRWGPNESNTRILLAHLAEEFADWNGHGRNQAMDLLNTILENAKQPPRDSLRLAVRFVIEADPSDTASRPGALKLALAALARNEPAGDPLLHACRKLIVEGLKDERVPCRVQAVRLAAMPRVGLLDRLPPLLKDADPEVRTLALLAVGGQEELVPTDDLLPLLHDSSTEVRLICEQALRTRGLGSAQLQLAKALCDPQPGVRARLPALVHDFPELDTRVWLERLSRDPSPAVRAAAVRVASERDDAGLRDRLLEMSRKDADQTVRQIAEFYLQHPRRNIK